MGDLRASGVDLADGSKPVPRADPRVKPGGRLTDGRDEPGHDGAVGKPAASVIPGLVPGIHVGAGRKRENRSTVAADSHSALLSSIACAIVLTSVYSSSAPAGTPRASRVTFIAASRARTSSVM